METSSIPVMGICLGHQLLALAVGARTIKLKYGNRAHNIPALDLTTGQCHITSQNHGYAIDASSLPSEFKEYFVNLNDGSNEGMSQENLPPFSPVSLTKPLGMMHKTRPIFSTQFHPEAKGGPMDSSYLFDKYLDMVRQAKSSQAVYKDNRPSQFLLDVMSRERVGVEPEKIASSG
jgi:carbamoyl-phosphate synthase small subunit